MTHKKVVIVFLMFVFIGYTAGCESKHKTKEERYPDGKLKADYTCNDAGVPDGTFKTYYESGMIKDEGNYKDGKLEGICKSYYENGKLKSAGNYKAGSPEGGLANYDENGMLKKAGNDKAGNKEEMETSVKDTPLANSLRKQGENKYTPNPKRWSEY